MPSPSPIARLRIVGKAEAISFLLLLGVAMPLKYLADLPLAVKIVGWAHGVLFMALCWVLFNVWQDLRWPLTRVAMVFIAALIPFGPFLIDRRLADEQSA